MNIPLCVLAVAFTVGLPAWIMLKHPDDADNAVAHIATPRPYEHAAAAYEAHGGRSRTLSPNAS